MSDYVIPEPEPKEIDERLSIELRHLAENAVLRGKPSGDEKCENCRYYLEPYAAPHLSLLCLDAVLGLRSLVRHGVPPLAPPLRSDEDANLGVPAIGDVGVRLEVVATVLALLVAGRLSPQHGILGQVA